MGVAFAHGRGFANIAELFGISSPETVAGLDLVGKSRPLAEHDRGLQGVEPAVHSHEVVVVAPDAAMRADRPHFFGHAVVIGEKRTALAVASKRLGRIKTRAGNVSDAAAFASMPSGSKTLRRIFDHSNPMTVGDGIDRIIVGHLTKETHWQKSLGARSDGSLDAIHGDVEIQRIDIDKNRPRADLEHHLGGADPSEGNCEHLVAGADPESAQRDLQTIRATRDRDRMATSDEAGQMPFQLLDLGAHDETAVLQHAVDAVVDGVFEFPVLSLEVDEIHAALRARPSTPMISFLSHEPHDVFFTRAPLGSVDSLRHGLRPEVGLRRTAP